ncbi:MAG: RNA polymerase sigma factor [Phycisphaerales bacterium]|nr:RNA polymerase sigma factor [Phycisphaerales bacterium]
MDDIARAKRGDPAALSRIISGHEAFVGRILWRFTRDRNDWESLVQDTFVEMCSSIRGFRSESSLERWLARIATRVGYRFWRQRSRDRSRVSQLSDDALRALAASQAPVEAAQLLHELLGRIDPPERLALVLVYIEGLSMSEAAARAGWSAGGMKMRVHRARQRLAEVARSCGIEPGDLQ